MSYALLKKSFAMIYAAPETAGTYSEVALVGGTKERPIS